MIEKKKPNCKKFHHIIITINSKNACFFTFTALEGENKGYTCVLKDTYVA